MYASLPHILRKADFERHWREMFDALDDRRQRVVQEFGSLDWIAGDLLALLEEHHHQPVCDLEPIVRRFLVEQGFVDENGDRVIDDEERQHLDIKVDLILRVLESIRERCRARGLWSDAPATPQMFG